MYFNRVILAALSLTSYVSCLPNSVEERQTVSISGNLQVNIGGVINTVTDDLTKINDIVKSFGPTTDPTTQIKLANQLNTIGKAIETQLIAGAPAVQAILAKLPTSGLSVADLTALTFIVNAVKSFATAVTTTLSATQSQVSAATKQLIAEELNAITAALKTFVTPVLTYAGSIAKNSGGGVSGSKDLLSSLATSVQSLLSGLGSVLSSVGLQVPSLPGFSSLLPAINLPI